MKTFQTKHRVDHSAQNMFQLVADIENYPEFLPLCHALKIRTTEQHGTVQILIADMTIAYKFLHETFTSRVTLDREASLITVEYLDGPFHHLENRWHFESVTENTCDIDFFISYRFNSRSLQILAGTVFDKAFRKFTTAFEKRADEVYGTTSSKNIHI